jgi:hypothetical protein
LTEYTFESIFLRVVDVIATDEFKAWFDGLEEVHVDRVIVAVSKLEQAGVALGHPASSAIKGASFALRELRIQSSGHALRVFYAFDPRRDAVLIIGGDKTGRNGDDFYAEMVATSERIWRAYLAEQEHGEHDEE